MNIAANKKQQHKLMYESAEGPDVAEEGAGVWEEEGVGRFWHSMIYSPH